MTTTFSPVEASGPLKKRHERGYGLYRNLLDCFGTERERYCIAWSPENAQCGVLLYYPYGVDDPCVVWNLGQVRRFPNGRVNVQFVRSIWEEVIEYLDKQFPGNWRTVQFMVC